MYIPELFHTNKTVGEVKPEIAASPMIPHFPPTEGLHARLLRRQAVSQTRSEPPGKGRLTLVFINVSGSYPFLTSLIPRRRARTQPQPRGLPRMACAWRR